MVQACITEAVNEAQAGRAHTCQFPKMWFRPSRARNGVMGLAQRQETRKSHTHTKAILLDFSFRRGGRMGRLCAAADRIR